MNNHPFTRYAQALIMAEYNLPCVDNITGKHISNELEKGLNTFRMAPASSLDGKEKVNFIYIREAKGDTKSGVFLSPHILTPDKQAKNIWNEGNSMIKKLQVNELTKTDNIKMSIAPTAGEYLSFSLTIGRGKPKGTLAEIGLNAVTTVTRMKPSLQYRIEKKGRPETSNTCIIPDINIDALVEFIQLFRKLLLSKTSDSLMVGNVVLSKSNTYEPKRPLIYKGNFPNPPRSSALGSVALLGAIGEFAKEVDVSELAKRVLESLKGATIYMIKYGGASTFTYNHHIVDLAKKGKLGQIIDSIYYTQLYNEGRRTSQSSSYQKFDLFSSRFIHLFNIPAFKDFLAFRAEYPYTLNILLNTYFKKIEMIDPKIVSSARSLGKWLNKVAYFTAKSEVKEGTGNYWEEVRKIKAKVLIELESSTFSAKTGDALIAQAITRAGRLSGMDAPEEASLFMEKTASGELKIENAKNLLIAFSRLKNTDEQKEILSENDSESENEEPELEDYSNE